MDNTRVTIGITTYNIGEYIDSCIESILKQKTSFKYEIIVVDDASTDETTKKLYRFKQLYPDIIKLILKCKNDGSLHSSNLLFNNIKSEYFSFIDGDDFWLTEDRLQNAVDFLDANSGFALYGGNTLYIKDNSVKGLVIDKKFTNKEYSFNDYLECRCPFVHTSSIVLRNCIYLYGMPKYYLDNENTIYNCAFRGEDLRFIEHLKKGKLYVSPEIFSVYRIHEHGVWQGSSNIKKMIESCLSNIIYVDLYPELAHISSNRFISTYREIMELIKNKYIMSDEEHFLFVSLLEEIRKKKLFAV